MYYGEADVDVLLFTCNDDAHASAPVVAALRERGARPWVLESDRFPTQVGLSWSGPGRGVLDFGAGERLALAELGAIWMRRVAVGERLPRGSIPSRSTPARATRPCN